MRMIKLNIIIFLFSISCNSQEKIVDHQIDPNLFGFCTSNSFTYVDTYDTSFLSKIEEISPNVLRFPGGTIGNFYHPNKVAYGFTPADVELWYSGRFSNRVRTLKQAALKKGHDNDYIDDFIVLAKTVNAKVIVNANILTAEKNEIIFVLNRFKEEGIEVLGVELGSELSNRAYKKKIKSVYDYIKLAKVCSENIKNNFPEMKVGVVAAPLKKKMPNRLKSWNSILAKEDFYDAIIHHSYHTVVDGEADAGVMVSEEESGHSKKNQFNLYKNRILEEMQTGFTSRIKEYNFIFNNREIWITEWNLQMTKTTGNTLLQSLFVSHYLLELLSSPELQNIKIATYHNLAGRDVSGSIFKGVKDGFEIHSTYLPFKYIGDIFDYNVVRIDKYESDNTFTYNCYNKNDNLVISYTIDWIKNHFEYKNYSNDNIRNHKVYYSENLFDIADNKGMLKLDTSILID